ncbi:hypothetical protein BaRGS_00000637 [Batillaria attramentaria]|uniref:Uncharacterized protein n=1 Tax=Batillaria attramentaria TaxID=370345 RepID=A0ABD0MBI1_9CAEN
MQPRRRVAALSAWQTLNENRSRAPPCVYESSRSNRLRPLYVIRALAETTEDRSRAPFLVARRYRRVTKSSEDTEAAHLYVKKGAKCRPVTGKMQL